MVVHGEIEIEIEMRDTFVLECGQDTYGGG